MRWPQPPLVHGCPVFTPGHQGQFCTVELARVTCPHCVMDQFALDEERSSNGVRRLETWMEVTLRAYALSDARWGFLETYARWRSFFSVFVMQVSDGFAGRPR